MGLELTTQRPRVTCSTDRTSRTLLTCSSNCKSLFLHGTPCGYNSHCVIPRDEVKSEFRLKMKRTPSPEAVIFTLGLFCRSGPSAPRATYWNPALGELPKWGRGCAWLTQSEGHATLDQMTLFPKLLSLVHSLACPLAYHC